MNLETQVAVLSTEIAGLKETVISKIDELQVDVKEGHERIHDVENAQAVLQERVSHMRWFLLGVNALSNAVVGLIAWFKT